MNRPSFRIEAGLGFGFPIEIKTPTNLYKPTSNLQMRFHSIIIASLSMFFTAAAAIDSKISAMLFDAAGIKGFMKKYMEQVIQLSNQVHSSFAALEGSKSLVAASYRVAPEQAAEFRSLFEEFVEIQDLQHRLIKPSGLLARGKSVKSKMLKLTTENPIIGIQMTNVAEDYIRLTAFSSIQALQKEPLNTLHQQVLKGAKERLVGEFAVRSQILKDHPDLLAHFPEATVLEKNNRLIEKLGLDQRIAKVNADLIKLPGHRFLLEQKAYLIKTRADLLKFELDVEPVGWSIGSKVGMGMATILTFVGLPLGLIIGLSGSDTPMHQSQVYESKVKGGVSASPHYPIPNFTGNTIVLQ